MRPSMDFKRSKYSTKRQEEVKKTLVAPDSSYVRMLTLYPLTNGIINHRHCVHRPVSIYLKV